MATSPDVLCKYRGPDRVDDLRALAIRFTPPGEFNDPFEALVAVEGVFAPSSVEELVRSTHAEAAKDGVELDDNEVRGDFEAGNVRGAEAAPKIISRLTNETFGVLSLSEPNDDILMWSHYAWSHRGFLIGFDARHKWFDQREHQSDVVNHLRPVEYRKDRPRVYLNDVSLTPNDDSSRLAADIFLRKSDHWSYEREWRIARPLSAADEILPEGIHLFRFPPDALVEVVIGWRASFSTRAAIREALDDPRFGHVRLRHARISDTDYALVIQDA